MSRRSSMDTQFACDAFALLMHHRPWAEDHPLLLRPGAELREAKPGTAVWGVGLDGYAEVAPGLHVYAVRGPWTANCLLAQGLSVPAVFGDPMLLLPRYLPELRQLAKEKTIETLAVTAGSAVDSDDVTYVSLADEPMRAVLRAIARSRFVLSTSVTAVAAAEALGIPARFVEGRGSSEFARRDYLAGTGRTFERIEVSVAEARKLGGFPAPVVDLDALDRAFPAEGSLTPPPPLAPPDYEIPNRLLEAWVEEVRDGRPSAARSLCDDLISTVRDSLQAGDSSWEERVSEAVEVLTHVAPDVVSDAQGSSARLLSALCGGDRHVIRTAFALDGLETSARLRGLVMLETHALVSISLATAEPEWPEMITLVAYGEDGEQTRVPWHLFDGQRRQWRMDLDFLVPLSAFAGEGPIRFSVLAAECEIAVTEGTQMPLTDPGYRPEAGTPALFESPSGQGIGVAR